MSTVPAETSAPVPNIRAFLVPVEDKRAKAALLCGIVAAFIAIITITMVRDIGLAASGILLSTVLFGLIPVVTRWCRPMMSLHIMAGICLLASWGGLCATSCGSLAPYDYILGFPTSVVGGGMHMIAGLLLFRLRSGRDDEPMVALGMLMSAFLAGVSVFYSVILFRNGAWCSACILVHALMALQIVITAVSLIKGYVIFDIAKILLILLVGVLGMNAVYHNRDVVAATDHADQLAMYLRTSGISTAGPVSSVTEQQRMAEDRMQQAAAKDRTRDNDDILNPGRDHQRLVEDIARGATPPPTSLESVIRKRPAGMPNETSNLHSQPKVLPAATQPTNVVYRNLELINRVGAASAPMVVQISVNTLCPHCAEQIEEIIALLPEIRAGKVSVQVLPVFDSEAGKAVATAIIAAGCISDDALLRTCVAFFRNQKKIQQPSDIYSVIPPEVDASEIQKSIVANQRNIGLILRDARDIQLMRGVTTTPTVWVLRSGKPEPEREFKGNISAVVLRRALLSLE